MLLIVLNSFMLIRHLLDSTATNRKVGIGPAQQGVIAAQLQIIGTGSAANPAVYEHHTQGLPRRLQAQATGRRRRRLRRRLLRLRSSAIDTRTLPSDTDE